MTIASRLLIALSSLVALLATGRAQAQEPEPPPPVVSAPAPAASNGFGAPGVWVFTFQTADNGYGFGFFHKTKDGPTTVVLNPGVDYFLAPNLSVGANLSYAHTTGSANDVGGGVRVGYNLDLADSIGFWPTARFFVVHYGAASTTATSFGVLAPFLWHATSHFFLGGGPDLNRGLSGGDYTEFGLDFMLGGWF